MRLTCAHLAIDCDKALFIGFDPGILEAKFFGVGPAANGNQHLGKPFLDGFIFFIHQRDHHTVFLRLNFCHLGVQHD